MLSAAENVKEKRMLKTDEFLVQPFDYDDMRSDLCKKCTSHFTRQFSFFIYIGNMAAYNRSVSSKQFCHLVLGKPHVIFFQLYFKLCISIISRIEHDR